MTSCLLDQLHAICHVFDILSTTRVYFLFWPQGHCSYICITNVHVYTTYLHVLTNSVNDVTTINEALT